MEIDILEIIEEKHLHSENVIMKVKSKIGFRECKFSVPAISFSECQFSLIENYF